MRLLLIVNLLILAAMSNAALAQVTECTNKPAWQAAAGAHDTITFTELPLNTLVTTQYSNLGVHFTDGSDYIYSSSSFVNDGVGLNGAFDTISIAFSQPMTSIAVDFPGRVTFSLYYRNLLIYTSNDFGGAGLGWFAGLVSDQPFDSVVIVDPTGGVFIDDLHFGPPIPARGAIVAMTCAAICIARRRRR